MTNSSSLDRPFVSDVIAFFTNVRTCFDIGVVAAKSGVVFVGVVFVAASSRGDGGDDRGGARDGGRGRGGGARIEADGVGEGSEKRADRRGGEGGGGSGGGETKTAE